jgi:hypothetical protein
MKFLRRSYDGDIQISTNALMVALNEYRHGDYVRGFEYV